VRRSSGFARGRRAVAICQRSGQKMRYADLVEDGHVPGLLVHPDWWEPQHPQETPPDMRDPVALRDPSPEHRDAVPYDDTGDCPEEPQDSLYYESTTLLNAAGAGMTRFNLTSPVNYQIGICAYIQRDDDTWFVAETARDAEGNWVLYTVGAYSGPIASPGNVVYLTALGSGLARFLVTWDQADLIETIAHDDDSSVVSVAGADGTEPYGFAFELVGDLQQMTIVPQGPDSLLLNTFGVRGGVYVGDLRVIAEDDMGFIAQALLPVTITVPLLALAWSVTDIDVTLDTGDFSPEAMVSAVNGRAPYVFTFELIGDLEPLTIEPVVVGDTITVTVGSDDPSQVGFDTTSAPGPVIVPYYGSVAPTTVNGAAILAFNCASLGGVVYRWSFTLEGNRPADFIDAFEVEIAPDVFITLDPASANYSFIPADEDEGRYYDQTAWRWDVAPPNNWDAADIGEARDLVFSGGSGDSDTVRLGTAVAPAGTYTGFLRATVVDENGETVSSQIPVSITVLPMVSSWVETSLVQIVSPISYSDTVALVPAAGGLAPYSYDFALVGGAPFTLESVSATSVRILTGLDDGTFTGQIRATVTDALGQVLLLDLPFSIEVMAIEVSFTLAGDPDEDADALADAVYDNLIVAHQGSASLPQLAMYRASPSRNMLEPLPAAAFVDEVAAAYSRVEVRPGGSLIAVTTPLVSPFEVFYRRTGPARWARKTTGIPTGPGELYGGPHLFTRDGSYWIVQSSAAAPVVGRASLEVFRINGSNDFEQVTTPFDVYPSLGPVATWAQIAESPDEEMLAVIERPLTVRVYRRVALESWQEVATLVLPAGTLNSVQWSADSQYLSACADGAATRTWRIYRRENDDSFTSIVSDIFALSNAPSIGDGTGLAAWAGEYLMFAGVNRDGMVRVSGETYAWERSYGPGTGTYTGHIGGACAPIAHPNGRNFAYLSAGSTLRLNFWRADPSSYTYGAVFGDQRTAAAPGASKLGALSGFFSLPEWLP
jgi:hypothetical protein